MFAHRRPHASSHFSYSGGRLLRGLTTFVVAAACAVACEAPLTAQEKGELPRKPNIVFIMADDLGWADVAFHDGTAATPNLDRLAREGVELSQHYVAPVCSPTRAGLITGRCWSRFGVTAPTNNRALPWDTVTLPRALKSVGYDTCLTGKWHLGSRPEEGPNHFGFDHSYGSLAGGVSPWNHFYKQGPVSRTWHRNEAYVDETGHVTDLIADEAVSWLKGRTSAPFFLYVPFTAVHLPLKEPAEWLARVPTSITGEVPRHYAASVMHLDDAVGKIVAEVDRLGRRDDTLIVFTSDNGGSTAENNDLKYPDDNCPNGKLVGDNRPFRGQKGTLYEGGIRVPTVVSWPGKLKPAKVDVPVQIIDWLPTFAALAGYSASGDPKWDGQDIGPLLLGQSATPEPRTLYWAGPSFRQTAVRKGNWKLIVTRNDKTEVAELFDLAADPGEAADLSASHPKELAELRAELKRMAAADNDARVAPEQAKRKPTK